MAKYIKKHPVEAVQSEADGWIDTPEGRMTFKAGDWILTDVEGNKYPCKKSVFEKSYEPYVGKDSKEVSVDADEIFGD